VLDLDVAEGEGLEEEGFLGALSGREGGDVCDGHFGRNTITTWRSDYGLYAAKIGIRALEWMDGYKRASH
jgi:hypothetical protein